jgi:hypothetical protein
MRARRVLVVHLDRHRHALFLDEHRGADAARFLTRRRPIEQFDAPHGAKV